MANDYQNAVVGGAALSQVLQDLQGVIQPLQEVAAVVLKGSYKVVAVTADATAAESPAAGTEVDVLYVNDTAQEHIVTIPAATYRTNTGQDLLLVIPAGWYAEANFSNIGGTVYVRGM